MAAVDKIEEKRKPEDGGVGKVIGIYNHSERFFFRRRLEPAIILCVYGRFHNARMEKKIR